MIRKIVLALVCVFPIAGFAQTVTGTGVAAQFNQWKVFGTVNLVAGANPNTPISPCLLSAGSIQFPALAASTPIRINDANPALSETITPTAIVVGSICYATLTTTNAHTQPWYITSGSYGLQEAINNIASTSALNSIIVDRNWHAAGGGAATIFAVTAGSPYLAIQDSSIKPEIAYRWNGTRYVPNFSIDGIASPTIAAGAAAGTSPTVTNNTSSSGNSMTANVTTGTATTTGTLFTETVATAPPGGGNLNCVVNNVGANAPPAITLSTTTTVVTAAVAVAPAISTPYVLNITCN